MDRIFGSGRKPEVQLRNNIRALNRATRELDREVFRLSQQEKKLINDIKVMSRKGEMDAVKIMARDLVKTRRFSKKFTMMKANIQAVTLQVQVPITNNYQTLKSSNEMARAMKGVSRALASINKRLNLPEIQKIMNNFEKETAIMDMKQEMMEETIEDVTGEVEDDEESEALVTKVLDELGISITKELDSLPATKAPVKVETNEELGDLEMRLERLRKS